MGKETLIACFSIQAVLSNLFVTKQMECFGLTITCSDVFTIGAVLSLNLLQEYFGKKLAKKAIWIVFFLLLFFIFMAEIHLLYVPSAFDTVDPSFQTIFSSTPRIICASFLISFFIQKLDLELYAFLKKRFKNKSLFLSFGLSALMTQLLDTVLFSYAALYGLVHSMSHIILMSYLIKVGIIICMSPFISLSKRLFKTEITHVPL